MYTQTLKLKLQIHKSQINDFIFFERNLFAMGVSVLFIDLVTRGENLFAPPLFVRSSSVSEEQDMKKLESRSMLRNRDYFTCKPHVAYM